MNILSVVPLGTTVQMSPDRAAVPSEGTPTALVRDGTTEGHDPAPDGPFTVTPVGLGDEPEANDGADLRRADDVERLDGYDSKKAERAALDVFDQIRQN